MRDCDCEGHEQDAVMENEWGSRQQGSVDESSKTSRARHVLRADKGLMWPMGEPEEKMERGMWCKTLGSHASDLCLGLGTLSTGW